MCMGCFFAKLAPFVPALAVAFGYGAYKCRRALFSSDGRLFLGRLK